MRWKCNSWAGTDFEPTVIPRKLLSNELWTLIRGWPMVPILPRCYNCKQVKRTLEPPTTTDEKSVLILICWICFKKKQKLLILDVKNKPEPMPHFACIKLPSVSHKIIEIFYKLGICNTEPWIFVLHHKCYRHWHNVWVGWVGEKKSFSFFHKFIVISSLTYKQTTAATTTTKSNNCR